jgi:hypothetical protein
MHKGHQTLIYLPLFALPAFASKDAGFDTVQVVLEMHCSSCHGEKKKKAGIDFTSFTSTQQAVENYKLWKQVEEQVSFGEMPPDSEEPMQEEGKGALLSWIRSTFDTSRPDPGPPPSRQLTRDEYDQTVRDLLWINFSAANSAGIPREEVVDGYRNRAGGLVIEPLLMEKYFSAADGALQYLFTNNGGRGGLDRLLQGQPKAGVPDKEAARIVLEGFLTRAFRRPVIKAEVEKYAKIADSSLDSGDGFKNAVKKAMKAPLVSPHFLVRLEQNPEGKGGTIARVPDHELAVRLSYFLWGTMPDNELSLAVAEGKLSTPEGLSGQVRRMLGDYRANSLTRNLFEEWLGLPGLNHSLPTQNHFPTFTRSLRDSMAREVREFCECLRKEDRSILELLDSDYTYVNPELARHYGIEPIPEGKEFVKVELNSAYHRGGVLSMAAILTMTSHRDRTKPTARGKWILDVLLGTPPPPPPANVGNFAPLDKNKPEPASFREKLDLHSEDPNCSVCHKKIDPLGFALENYDGIGAWREDIGGKPVDNRAKLPGIAEFKGVEGLRQILDGKKDLFVRNAAAQMLSYAIGRDLNYYDEPALDEITASLAANGYRYSAIVMGIVESYPFQHRKAE